MCFVAPRQPVEEAAVGLVAGGSGCAAAEQQADHAGAARGAQMRTEWVVQPPLQPVVPVMPPGVVERRVAEWQLPEDDRHAGAAREAGQIRVEPAEVGGTPPRPRVALDALV